jgi:uncharacterized protein (TIGR02147 family)
MARSLFSFHDYKDYIRQKIQESEAQWGLISRLATAAGCQRSYLSRVLSSEIHLTSDHLFRLARFWRLADDETDFFLLLLDREKAASPELRENLEGKIRARRREFEDLQKRVNRPRVAYGDKDLRYYAAWYVSAMHILVSIPRFQTADAIARALQLDARTVQDTLRFLETNGFVARDGARWAYRAGEQHVPRDSPLVSMHHNNWRARAVLDAQRTAGDGLHFTAVQSIDRRAWELLREKILAHIEEFSRIAAPAKEERLVCFSCDFFDVV